MMTLRASSALNRTFEERKIHILGVGNLGKLFAYSLARKKRPPPVTLLLHRQGLERDWEEAGRSIELITRGVSQKQHIQSVEVLAEGRNGVTASSEDPIVNVIVTTKAPRTTEALARIKHRLNQNSTILFAQNGMGTQINACSGRCCKCKIDFTQAYLRRSLGDFFRTWAPVQAILSASFLMACTLQVLSRSSMLALERFLSELHTLWSQLIQKGLKLRMKHR